MSSTERRVRHLHMQVTDMASARTFLPRMEDALRCASLPDHGARLLLVRRLALGPVAADASHAGLIRLIEARLADPAIEWIPGGSAAAESAGHVVFASALDARLLLAERLLQGRPCKAWYWRAAVPELTAAGSVPQQLESIGHAIARWPEAAVALPIWQDWLIRLQVTGHPGTSSPAAAAEPLMRTDQQIQHQPPSAAHHRPAVPAMPAIGEPVVPAAVTTAEVRGARQGRDARAAVSDAPRLAYQDQSADEPADTLRDLAISPVAATPEQHDRAASRQPPSSWSTPVPESAVIASTASDRPGRPTRSPTGRSAASASDRAADPPATAQYARHMSDRAEQPTAPVTPASPAEPSGGQPAELRPAGGGALSQAGGLLFLLPLLARLGLPAWRPHDPGPTSRLAHAILDLALARLGVAPDDPAWALLATARPVTPQGEPPDHAAAARCWLHAARCWLRRVGGISLASLVCRPGWIAWTATHIDVHFGLDDADLRVRRLGLDIDPGWLPWFGRVVNFHYGHCGAPRP